MHRDVKTKSNTTNYTIKYSGNLKNCYNSNNGVQLKERLWKRLCFGMEYRVLASSMHIVDMLSNSIIMHSVGVANLWLISISIYQRTKPLYNQTIEKRKQLNNSQPILRIFDWHNLTFTNVKRSEPCFLLHPMLLICSSKKVKLKWLFTSFGNHRFVCFAPHTLADDKVKYSKNEWKISHINCIEAEN